MSLPTLVDKVSIVGVATPLPSNPWSRMNSPWGKPSVPLVACSLEEVMSEQLAAEIDNQEQNQISNAVLDDQILLTEVVQSEATATTTDSELLDAEIAAKLAAEEMGVDSNDELIARYLQREFDKEYDAMIAEKEKKLNGTSKVSISFENYKMKHQRNESLGIKGQEEEEDDDDDGQEFPEFPQPTSWDSPKPIIGAKGYIGQGKSIVTKHDNVICGRRNAERLMEFPPEYVIGDGEGMDMKLPNNVYNKLKSYNLSENKKSQRVHEKKEHSTAIKAVDEKTRILMFKLVNSGLLTSIDGVVSTGKEAVIFKAVGGMKDQQELPKDMIMKVYKTTMNEFRTRAKYIAGDHRLSKDVLRKQNPRKTIKIWAEKEFMNLRRMRRNNILCPTPIVLKKHVLVMTCIGDEHPAPKLKEVKLSTEDMQDAYEQTIQLIKNLYRNCGLVHADLSEYNLLWHDGQVWVIDVSQSVEAENPTSNDFLLRDCHNVSDFFRQAGVHGVGTAEEIFMDVTNYSLEGTGAVFASQVTRYEKTNYSFDYYFEQSEAKREQDLDIEDSSEEEEEEEEEDDDDNIEDDKVPPAVTEPISNEENLEMAGGSSH
uniref:Serine/threonine-protein kinase RIO3 n=1 Tax=Arion vulgaris TaxID=1028688 RepID=A0A0B7B4R4_9EUPU